MPESGAVYSDPTIAIRDRFLGPSLLYPFAVDMAQRLSRLSSGPLLEIVADTGVLTQIIASTLAADVTIVATDPDEALVGHASVKPGLARVTWRTADPRALPFRPAAFNTITCLFGVMSLPDRVQAFTEVRRVMKPGGRFLFAVPAGLRHMPVAQHVQLALDDYFPGDPPRFLTEVMHGYADNETIDDDLTQAAFTDAIYTSADLTYAAASARVAAIGYCLGTPLRWEIQARAPDEVERVTEAVTEALTRRFGYGAIETSMRAHIVSASA
jgi:SAM-dependent methyltransferase